MELQTLRNIERLLQMIDVANYRVGPLIEIADNGVNLVVELVGERVLISSAIAIEYTDQEALLRAACERWTPRSTDGLPHRFFCTDTQLFVSALCPADGKGETWYRIVLMQRRYLDSLRYMLSVQ